MTDGRFICADTEDDAKELQQSGRSGFDKRLTQVAALSEDGRETFHARGPDGGKRFLAWFDQRPERFCYFHNLQYDLGNLFRNELDAVDVTLVGGRLIRAVWGDKEFRDSFNLWPMSVAKLAPAFGLKKLEFDAESEAYVFGDVEIIRQAMVFAWRFVDLCGLKTLPPTLGGLCVKLWQFWGGKNRHDSSELSRAALFGGRVELFKSVSESSVIGYTDINSLYPSVMTGEFPESMEPCPKGLPDFGVATATVRVPEMEIAPLPFRDLETERILYPWGRFTGTWTTHELRNAETMGCTIEKVHEARGTSVGVKPYADFVQKLYAARLQSESGAEKLFFKLLMNNLYGRLGTTGKIGRSVYQTPKNRDAGVPYGRKVLVEYSMPLSDETNWGHAAYVTSYGRLALLRHLLAIGADRLIYCDTDSAIFDTPGLLGLGFQGADGDLHHNARVENIPFPTGSDLGTMKIENWLRGVVCYAPKSYRAGNDYKAKGVPKRLAREFLEKGRAEFDLPYRLREAVAWFDRGNAKSLSVWRRIVKQWQCDYDRKEKRGNRFSPCKVNAV